ncbi:MAG: HdeA/HdeB family chaperone [Pleurocapsa sp.]
MQFKLFPLRTAIAELTIGIAFVAIFTILSPALVAAKNDFLTIDMSNLTCEEFVDLGRMEKIMGLVWLSGWAAQRQGNFTFTADRTVLSKRKDALENACENNEQDLVINQLIPQRREN